MSIKMSDTVVIPASRDYVLQALDDPEVLKHAIPGCDTLERTDNGRFDATIGLKIGPIKTRFQGEVAVDHSKAPNNISLTGKGTGGAAGFAQGAAIVHLSPTPEGETRLEYTVDAKVGGKLAQLGSRLVLAAGRKLAAQFFNSISETMAKNAVN